MRNFNLISVLAVIAVTAKEYEPPNNGFNPDSSRGSGTRLIQSQPCPDSSRGSGRRDCFS